MSISAKQILDSPVADGPAGFGIYQEAVGTARVDGDAVCIDLAPSKESLANAHAQNDAGVNKKFAELDRMRPKKHRGRACFGGWGFGGR